MNIVTPVVRTDLLIFTIILNIILLIYIKKHTTRRSYSLKLLNRVILSLIVVTSLEVVSWLTGDAGNTAQIPFHYLSNAFYLVFLVVPASFGLSYLDYKILGNKKRNKRRLFVYMIPVYLSICFGIVNIFYDGFLFKIDAFNHYSRGIAVPINLALIYVFLTIVLLSFKKHKKMITGRISQSIIIFYFIPVIGVLLQILAYGTTFVMPAYTIATFIIFLIHDKDEMGKDELTDLYTRSKLASRLDFKIKAEQPFLLIMADLDGFKNINDTYGHAEGDKVLIKVSEILLKVINIEDTVCRYGGDEFLILIEYEKDISNHIIKRIDSALKKHNKSVPYKVIFSYGHEFYPNPKNLDRETLLKCVDEKMYKNKFSKKL